MESNGIPNKIHVSEATANELIALKKGAWLTKREDLITAKGKGKMVTYWVEPKKGTGSICSALTFDTNDSNELPPFDSTSPCSNAVAPSESPPSKLAKLDNCSTEQSPAQFYEC